MNKEEIAFKILELYYLKIYKSYGIDLEDFVKIYNVILKKLYYGDSNE